MSTDIARSFPQSWRALLIGVIFAGCSFAIQGRQGINFADEGFLWYGVQRTAAGEVPLRDFQSYDPGRYYWCAAGTFLFGKGLVALRFSEAAFQALGLWAGILAANRIARRWIMLTCIGLMLTVWMFPSHKLFDHALLLMGLWVAARMVEKPSRQRVIGAGLFVGLCAFFGKNHALYNFVAEGALLLLLYLKTPAEAPLSRIALWCASVMAGLMPLIVMLLCVPGFFPSYVESIESIFRNGTNLGIPIPWPWQISFASDPFTIARQLLLGLFLVALPVGYIIAIALCIAMPAQKVRDHALFTACAFVGLLYLHHAFSRADFNHLAQSIHPFTLGIMAAPLWFGEHTRFRLPILGVLLTSGLLVVGRSMAIYQHLISPVAWVPYDAGGKIFVPASTSQLCDCLRQFSKGNIPADEGVLIAPFTPGLYPILGRQSPLWDLYFLFPAPEQRQGAMIRSLIDKNVNWAIVADTTLDNREDRRFSATHRLVWEYLMENFEPVDRPCMPRFIKILHRRTTP
jgi:hypothetical protein